MKTLHFLHKKYTYRLHDVFKWVTPVAIIEWRNWGALRGQGKKCRPT